MKPLTITQAAKVTGVSRSTLYRYIKAGKLARAADGKIDAVALQRAGLRLLNPETTATSCISPQQGVLMVYKPDHQAFTASAEPPPRQSSTSDVSSELIATLRDELASAKERERSAREAARQEQERLMILLAQEQCNVQQLLATERVHPDRGFRDSKLRPDVHKGMAGILLTVTSLFAAFLILI